MNIRHIAEIDLMVFNFVLFMVIKCHHISHIILWQVLKDNLGQMISSVALAIKSFNMFNCVQRN